MNTVHKHFARTTLARALGAAVLGMATSAALAQEQASPQPATGGEEVTELDAVTVKGFRRSLQYSTEAKRDATGFTDSIFAEDIGKFPDTNIAESLMRIPGVQLQRDVNGEGTNVSIRGLGNSFTKTLINGGEVATASIGLVDGNGNREVDLNLFPTEFFSQLTVHKTPEASLQEGGIGGVVDMRSVRPFDNPGTHGTYSIQATRNEVVDTTSPRGSVFGSWTNEAGTFGVLGGVAIIRGKGGATGFESIGWTNPGLTWQQCGLAVPPGSTANSAAPACNTSGGGNWSIPNTVPDQQAVIDAGLVPGENIDQAWLLAHNPGLTIEQISEALIPRLARPMHTAGKDDRDSYVASLEWRPTDSAHYYLDLMYSKKETVNDRIDMNLIGRNGQAIPLGMTVDGNNVVQTATLTNAQFFLEARTFIQEADYWRINPGATWWVNDDFRIDAQASHSRSKMHRFLPTFFVNSPYTNVEYDGTGKLPAITTDLDLNDPAAGWTLAGGRFNTDADGRTTETTSARVDLQFGDDSRNLSFGLAYDDTLRKQQGFANSAYQDHVMATLTDADLVQYLQPGPFGFVTFDFDAIKAATDWYSYAAANTESGGSSATGVSTGAIAETNVGTYLEANGEWDLAGRTLRYNAGARYIGTSQRISGPVTVNDMTQWVALDTSYNELLPSANLAWDVAEDWVVRLAASRTMTRPNPTAMLPNMSFGDPSASQATQGNPELKSYTSDNIDLGAEWYTGDEGLVALTLFQKNVDGFTYQGSNTIPFRSLGIAFEDLNSTQQTAINQRGGPDQATVVVTQQVNADAELRIRGWEAIWVQPLDFVFDGLGFMANYTDIDLAARGEQADRLAGNLYGIAPVMWNATAYWENDVASIRASYNHSDAFPTSGLNENGIIYARRYFYERNWIDLSASYTFRSLPTQPQLTLNVNNLTRQKSRGQYFAFENAPYEYYEPGRTVMLGLRGTW
jgi:TonB-dependent receptor